MASPIDDLVHALDEDPDRREVLRRALLGDEQDVQSSLRALAEAQRGTETQLQALAAQVAALAEAQRRTETRLEALAEAQHRTETRLEELAVEMKALAKAQRNTDARLDALIEVVSGLVDVVSGVHDRLGRLDGDALERRYRERGPAYFAPIARRLRLVDASALAVIVDDAEQAGTLSEGEARAVMLADAVFSGRLRASGEPVHLVVEASVTVGRHDVRRARERATLLERVVDTPVVAVVAGEFVPHPVAEAAQDAGVWFVGDGRAYGPDTPVDEP